MLKMKIVFGLLFSFFLFSCEEKISKNDLEEYKSMMDIRLGHLGNAIIMQGRLLDSFNLSNERADEDHFKEAEELVKSNLESFGRSDELRNLKIPNSRKLRESQKEVKITKKYENLIGQVITGQVKRINRDFLLLEIEEDLNAQIPRDQIIPGEIFKLNDKVRAVIKEIITTPRGPQIILSRTDERLVVELFSQEVPEISEGTIELKLYPGIQAIDQKLQ